MAIKLIKKIPAKSLDIAACEKADLIDQIGALQPEAAKITAKIKALGEDLKGYNALMKELQEWLSEQPDDDKEKETVVRYGKTHMVTGGKRALEREINDIQKVIEAMNVDVFLKVATVTLKDIDAYTTPDQQKEFITESRGKRKIAVSVRPDKS